MSDMGNQGSYYGALGIAFFALSGIAEYTKNYYEQEAEAVKESFKEANRIAASAKLAKQMGDMQTYQTFQAELKEKMHDFDGKVHTLLKKLTATDDDVKQSFKTDTGLNWNKQMLNIKKVGGDVKDLKSYKKLYGAAIKAERIAKYGQAVGFGLDAADATNEVYEACENNPHSPHCVKTVYEQSFELGMSTAGSVAGTAIGKGLCTKATIAKQACMLVIPPTAAILGDLAGKATGKVFGDGFYYLDEKLHSYQLELPATPEEQ